MPLLSSGDAASRAKLYTSQAATLQATTDRAWLVTSLHCREEKQERLVQLHVDTATSAYNFNHISLHMGLTDLLDVTASISLSESC